jgi:hypothetical protein
MFMGIPDDNQFMALARHRLGHPFPQLPKQPGCNKLLSAVAPTVARVIPHAAIASPSFCAGLRPLTPTPVPCGQSRETARRSELAGYASYGYCKSRSRYFWGFRLYLLCASDGMPIRFERAGAPGRRGRCSMGSTWRATPSPPTKTSLARSSTNR